MSKRRHRDYSPTNENSLIGSLISSGQQLVKSDTESGDEQDRLDEELFTIESESSDGSSVEVDNTDEDPDYDPSHLDHLSSEEEQP